MTSLPLNQVLQGDCVALMKALPSSSVDLVFADPPYNLQLRGRLTRPDNSLVDAVDDDWDQFDSFKAYDEFSQAWLAEVRRLLKPNGSLWVIGSYHNIFRLGTMIQNLGFWILNDVVWVKNNPMPNFKGTRFTNAHETLIWAGRSQGARCCFNYASMKALNDDIQMRSDWYFPLCNGRERLRDGGGEKLHPTQKPEGLLYRILMACSNPGDVVLDPFFGTGTSGAVAKALGRHFIGLEQDADYVKAARQRLDKVVIKDSGDLLLPLNRRRENRISIGSLLEAGLLATGDVLKGGHNGREYSAILCADGTVTIEGGGRGSIHKVGAEVQKSSACNGWTFWKIQRDGQWQTLDSVRTEAREIRKM